MAGKRITFRMCPRDRKKVARRRSTVCTLRLRGSNTAGAGHHAGEKRQHSRQGQRQKNPNLLAVQRAEINASWIRLVQERPTPGTPSAALQGQANKRIK